MKLCPECSTSPWPFVMAVFISAVVAFVTWLTLSLSGLGATGRLVASGGAFIAVLSTILHYVLSCMKRHCHHGREAVHSHRVAH
jgi:hypothetical protein